MRAAKVYDASRGLATPAILNIKYNKRTLKITINNLIKYNVMSTTMLNIILE
jgi:hypothetical protein